MFVRESSVSFSPRPFAPIPVTKVRWRGTVRKGFFEFDGEVTPENYYDVASSIPFNFTLRRVKFINVSEAIDVRIIVGPVGNELVFTSGEAGQSYPATTINLPASGVWDYFCNTGVSDFITLNSGDFVSPGVGSGGILADFFYTRP